MGKRKVTGIQTRAEGYTPRSNVAVVMKSSDGVDEVGGRVASLMTSPELAAQRVIAVCEGKTGHGLKWLDYPGHTLLEENEEISKGVNGNERKIPTQDLDCRVQRVSG